MTPFSYKRASDLEPSHSCLHEAELAILNQQAARIDMFIEEAEPLLEYVRAEIKRNERRAEFYSKITEHVLGAGVIAIFAYFGSWLISKVQLDLGVR